MNESKNKNIILTRCSINILQNICNFIHAGILDKSWKLHETIMTRTEVSWLAWVIGDQYQEE